MSTSPRTGELRWCTTPKLTCAVLLSISAFAILESLIFLSAAAGATASVLQVGTRIEAMFDGAHSDTGEWYQGVVAKVHDRMGMGGKVTHLYDVVYDDGDEDKKLEEKYVRRAGEEGRERGGGEGPNDVHHIAFWICHDDINPPKCTSYRLLDLS